MSCDDLKDLLALHAIGDTDVEEALRVEEHLPACAACCAALDDYAGIAAAARDDLRIVPDMPSELAAWSGPVAPSAPTTWWPRLAAAAVLLLFGVLAGRWSVESPRPRPEGGSPVAGPAVQRPALRRLGGAPLSVFSPAARPWLRDVARREPTEPADDES